MTLGIRFLFSSSIDLHIAALPFPGGIASRSLDAALGTSGNAVLPLHTFQADSRLRQDEPRKFTSNTYRDRV